MNDFEFMIIVAAFLFLSWVWVTK